MARKVVLLHGYSSNADSLGPWRDALLGRDYSIEDIRLGDYISLSNEITLRDIAEGFDRALREQVGLAPDEEFDAIVHSTGSLVVREWLVSYEGRRRRLKHLIGLAPANFGSPMAHRGRSVLGAVWKGGRNDIGGGDFLEPGDRILSALELGSSYTWDLAHRDLLAPADVDRGAAGDSLKPIYSDHPDTPYPFVFIGTKQYRFMNLVIHEDGYDGTVRWAGAALDTRKLVIDLTRLPPPGATEPIPDDERVHEAPRASTWIPLVFADGLNHSTILKDPDDLIEPVIDALAVHDAAGYRAWKAAHSGGARPDKEWQQFVVRVVDERGDPVPDYYIAMGTGEGEQFKPLEEFSVDVHQYREDPSFRCFHVNIDDIRPRLQGPLQLRLLASSGTPWVGYYGVQSEAARPLGERGDRVPWTAKLDLKLPADIDFFFPYTTTLVEIRLNREPTPPFDPDDPQPMKLIRFTG